MKPYVAVALASILALSLHPALANPKNGPQQMSPPDGIRVAQSFSQDHYCPTDNMLLTFTGQTETEWGRLLGVYRCPAGHAWLIPMDPSPPVPSFTVDACPICGMSTIFTGETVTQMGKLYKVQRCPAGHESLKPFDAP